jgi:hypothetical protein
MGDTSTKSRYFINDWYLGLHNIIDKNNFSHIGLHKDLYSRKDMNLARFSIDCMQVCCMARTSEITHSAIR